MSALPSSFSINEINASAIISGEFCTHFKQIVNKKWLIVKFFPLELGIIGMKKGWMDGRRTRGREDGGRGEDEKTRDKGRGKMDDGRRSEVGDQRSGVGGRRAQEEGRGKMDGGRRSEVGGQQLQIKSDRDLKVYRKAFDSAMEIMSTYSPCYTQWRRRLMRSVVPPPSETIVISPGCMV